MPATKKARGDFQPKVDHDQKTISDKADIVSEPTKDWRVSGSGSNYEKGFVIELDLSFIQKRETLLY
jgi:hypothetical protein